jgi:hypothetical protein
MRPPLVQGLHKDIVLILLLYLVSRAVQLTSRQATEAAQSVLHNYRGARNQGIHKHVHVGGRHLIHRDKMDGVRLTTSNLDLSQGDLDAYQEELPSTQLVNALIQCYNHFSSPNSSLPTPSEPRPDTTDR